MKKVLLALIGLVSIGIIYFGIGHFRSTHFPKDEAGFREFITEDYELVIPNQEPEAVLVLFGGFPEMAQDIKREFTILDSAIEQGIALAYMNYSQRLWLEEDEKHDLADLLQKIFQENDLPKTRIYYGGYSSGGNVALLVSDFLVEQNSTLAPNGVFVIDSPIDLAALFRSSEKNLERNFSKPSVQESTWIIESLGQNFGDPADSLSNYEQYAIFTSETGNIQNLQHLKNTRIRLYTEPDTLWWKVNRMADLDQMNAFYLEALSSHLVHSGYEDVEFIATENKGYRANGMRHPHSWSIVDQDELIGWMKE